VRIGQRRLWGRPVVVARGEGRYRSYEGRKACIILEIGIINHIYAMIKDMGIRLENRLAVPLTVFV
jgi:hypothetical protein